MEMYLFTFFRNEVFFFPFFSFSSVVELSIASYTSLSGSSDALFGSSNSPNIDYRDIDTFNVLGQNSVEEK